MKTITYNPETHVLVPREPSEEMCDAATADSCWEYMNPPPSTAYRLMLAAAPQPEPVESEPVAWMNTNGAFNHMKKAEQDALHAEAMSKLTEMVRAAQKPQPDRVAELEAALKVACAALLKYSNGANGAIVKTNEVLK